MCSSIHSFALTGVIFHPELQVLTTSMRFEPEPAIDVSYAFPLPAVLPSKEVFSSATLPVT